MEQVIECMDKCCIANNMKENHERIHTLGEQDTSHSSEPEDICDSDIHQSPTAFPVACGDKKIRPFTCPAQHDTTFSVYDCSG